MPTRPTTSLRPPASLPCRSKPGAYGQLGLADLFELREECLREFGFSDVYRRVRSAACCPCFAALEGAAEAAPRPRKRRRICEQHLTRGAPLFARSTLVRSTER